MDENNRSPEHDAPSNPLALIVEDEDELAKIFAIALEKADYKTAIAADGQTALDWLASNVPAVVVLDLSLPHIPGAQVLDYIRAEARLAKTRVIVASADVQRAEALRGRANLVLIKPIGFSQLRDLAARLRSAGTQDKT